MKRKTISNGAVCRSKLRIRAPFSVGTVIKPDQNTFSRQQQAVCLKHKMARGHVAHPWRCSGFRVSLCVFSICVQCPVLQRQMLPPQPLNKPAQHGREHLFRTGTELSCGQIAYLINAVMEISEKKRRMTALFASSAICSLCFSSVFLWSHFQFGGENTKLMTHSCFYCVIKPFLCFLFHNCNFRNTRTQIKRSFF